MSDFKTLQENVDLIYQQNKKLLKAMKRAFGLLNDRLDILEIAMEKLENDTKSRQNQINPDTKSMIDKIEKRLSRMEKDQDILKLRMEEVRGQEDCDKQIYTDSDSFDSFGGVSPPFPKLTEK